MFCNPNSVAYKRYQRGVLLTMSEYVVVVFGVAFFFKHHSGTHGPLVYAMAVLPAIPILAMLGVVGIYLRDEKDEFLRWMMIRSMLWATAVLLAATTVVGFLQTYTDFKAPSAYFAFVGFWLVFGVVQGIQKWQTGRSDD